MIKPATTCQYRKSLQNRVLDFWFGGNLSLTGSLDSKYVKLWFGADSAVDKSIKDLFEDDLSKVSRNEDGIYDYLIEEPYSALAGVILLDQFSRNMFRDSPRMFATDTLALDLTRKCVKSNISAKISHPIMRNFLFMPYMHSEDLEAHKEGLQQFKATYESELETSPFKKTLLSNLLYMKRHTDIIERFGRYPHRNAILNRTSTAEEQAFLDGGGDTFDARPIPK